MQKIREKRGFSRYDNNGVLTGHVHYVYDVFDHLLATEVDPDGGGTYTEIQHYVLDVSPEIPVAGVPGTATAQPVLVLDGNQNLIQRNLVALSPVGVDQVMVQGTVNSLTVGDNDLFVAYDNLGTPRDDVDTTGTLVNHEVFSVYGEEVYDSNPSIVNWAGFAGGHADANTGLVNDYHRWYDPATGRWLSDDPAGFAAGDANLQRYAGNNSASQVDRTGLQFTACPTPTGALQGPPSSQPAGKPMPPILPPRPPIGGGARIQRWLDYANLWGMTTASLSGDFALYFRLLFPRGKFIFLHRNPIEAFAAALSGIEPASVAARDESWAESFADELCRLAASFELWHKDVGGIVVGYDTAMAESAAEIEAYLGETLLPPDDSTGSHVQD